MITVEKLLERAGESGLNEIVSNSLLEIIYEFENQPTVKRLAKVIIDIYGERPFIYEPAKRKLLFEYLKKNEATELCNKLDLKNKEPWIALSNFHLTSSRKESLDYFFQLDGLIEDNSKKVARYNQEEINPKYGLFAHQEDAATKIKKYLNEKRGRALLHMPTGSGKTRTAMSIAVDTLRSNESSRDNNLVVWLADTYELCDQAYDEFKKAWLYLGVGKCNVHRLYGDSDLTFGDVKSGFVVCGLQKLNSIRESNTSDFYSFGQRTRLVIFDEAHKVIAPTYQHVVDLFQVTGSASLLGLSATPGRATHDRDKNKAFAEFFRYKKVTLQIENYNSPVEYLEKMGFLAKVTYHSIAYEPKDLKLSPSEINSLSQGSEISDKHLKALGTDALRNIKVLSIALEQVSQGKKIILFACSVESAEAIYALLKYKKIAAGLITSKTPENVRNEVIKQYKTPSTSQDEVKILVNYGVLTTGFDAPSTNVAIIARPTNSLTLFSQMVGRATRGTNANGNEHSDVYYIKDTLTGMRDMVKAFSHWDDVWL